MKRIIDEFTELPISRERKRQLRLKRDNLEGYRAYMRQGMASRKKNNREYFLEYWKQYQIKKKLL